MIVGSGPQCDARLKNFLLFCNGWVEEIFIIFQSGHLV